ELSPGLQALHKAKAQSNKTFDEIGKAIGRDEVWVAAAFYGQACARLEKEDFIRLQEVFKGIEAYQEAASLLASDGPTFRGLGSASPTDPVIYRLYEGVLVYGHAIKAIIHEKFGDGIMSMIDCKVKVEKKEDPAGDRVLLTFDGKFLPYAKW
ncbi:Cyanase, partial [Fistulina hepatica ATCC 64428]